MATDADIVLVLEDHITSEINRVSKKIDSRTKTTNKRLREIHKELRIMNGRVIKNENDICWMKKIAITVMTSTGIGSIILGVIGKMIGWW